MKIITHSTHRNQMFSSMAFSPIALLNRAAQNGWLKNENPNPAKTSKSSTSNKGHNASSSSSTLQPLPTLSGWHGQNLFVPVKSTSQQLSSDKNHRELKHKAKQVQGLHSKVQDAAKSLPRESRLSSGTLHSSNGIRRHALGRHGLSSNGSQNSTQRHGTSLTINRSSRLGADSTSTSSGRPSRRPLSLSAHANTTVGNNTQSVLSHHGLTSLQSSRRSTISPNQNLGVGGSRLRQGAAGANRAGGSTARDAAESVGRNVVFRIGAEIFLKWGPVMAMANTLYNVTYKAAKEIGENSEAFKASTKQYFKDNDKGGTATTQKVKEHQAKPRSNEFLKHKEKEAEAEKASNFAKKVAKEIAEDVKRQEAEAQKKAAEAQKKEEETVQKKQKQTNSTPLPDAFEDKGGAPRVNNQSLQRDFKRDDNPRDQNGHKNPNNSVLSSWSLLTSPKGVVNGTGTWGGQGAGGQFLGGNQAAQIALINSVLGRVGKGGGMRRPGGSTRG